MKKNQTQTLHQSHSLFYPKSTEKWLNKIQQKDLSATFKKNAAQHSNAAAENKRLLDALLYNKNNIGWGDDQLDKKRLKTIAASTNASLLHYSGNCVLLARCFLYNLKFGRNVLAAKNSYPIREGLDVIDTENILFGHPLEQIDYSDDIEEIEQILLDFFRHYGERFFVMGALNFKVPFLGDMSHSFNAVVLGDRDNAVVQFVDPWKTLNNTPTIQQVNDSFPQATFVIKYHPGPLYELKPDTSPKLSA